MFFILSKKLFLFSKIFKCLYFHLNLCIFFSLSAIAFRASFKINLKVYDIINCVNKNFKLVSTIFYQILIFSSNGRPSKTMKCFHLKSSFRSQDIQTFVTFSLPFHTFQIQKGKWKWNNL